MRKLSVGLVLIGLLGAVMATPAAATTTRAAVEAQENMTTVLDPGTSGMDGTVVWSRGIVRVYEVTGNEFLAGTDTVVINYDLDLATGSGVLWGKDRIEPTAYPAGRFDCSWTGTFVAYTWTGRIVCHGSGSLDGRQLRLAVVAQPGGTVDTLSGYTFVPGQ